MLDSFVQGQIIGMHMAGVKSRRIATELQVNDRTVRSIIKRYQERGTIAPKPIPGRPRKYERLNGAIAVPAVAGGEGGADVGGEDGRSMDMEVDTSNVLPTSTPAPVPAPTQTTATATTTETVEWVISKKTGKLIKKRGKRGPYKKREKVSVAAPSVPVTIAPHPHANGHTSAGGEGSSVVATATGTAGAQDKYVFSAQGSALIKHDRQDEEDEGAESEDYYSA